MLNSQILKNKKGFTLIENIMYIAFVSVMAGVFIGFGNNVTNIREKARVVQLGMDSERAVTGLISQKVRGAVGVVSPVRTATSSELVLDMPNTVADLRFYVQEGVLYTDDDGDITQVSSEDLNFKFLEFKNVADIKQGSESVKVDFEVEARNMGTKAYEFSDEFEFVVSLRR